MEAQKILSQAQEWILGRLQERQGVLLPLIGVFAPKVEAEYLWHKQSGGDTTTYLMPPRVQLVFTAADYILDGALYASYGADVRDITVPADMVLGVSGLLEMSEERVLVTIREYLTEAVRNVFKGKRQQLFGLCDLFVTEEKDGLLLLNMDASDRLLEQLNYPFSSYSPVELQRGVTFPGIDESEEAYTKQIQQTPIHTVKEEVREEIVIPMISEPVVVEPAATVEQDRVHSPGLSDQKEEQKPSKSNAKWVVILGGVIATIAIIWAVSSNKKGDTQPVVVETPAPIEVIEQAPTEPIALDTVILDNGMTLAKLAQKYYNNPRYWIYIYMYNKESIKDPNNVSLGTTLVIPPLEKYDLLTDSLAARNEAIQWEYIIQTGNFKSFEEQRKTLKPYEKK